MDFASNFSTCRFAAAAAALVTTLILSPAVHAAGGTGLGLKRATLIRLSEGGNTFDSAIVPRHQQHCDIKPGKVTLINAIPGNADTMAYNDSATKTIDTKLVEFAVVAFYKDNKVALGDVAQPADQKGIRFTLEEALLKADKTDNTSLEVKIKTLREQLLELCQSADASAATKE